MKKQELNLNTEELFEEKYEFHREQIVKVITESKVKSFLKSFIPKMIIEGKNLEQYLKDQHSSDTDIIDMIR